MSILIKNASYLIREHNRIENGKDILIEGAHISKIAGSIEATANTKIIDAEGKLVAPGFINSHTHLYQNLLEGMDDRVSLFDWVDKITFPLCSNITTKLNKKDSKKNYSFVVFISGH